jgi:hypothetical protein
MERIVPNTGDVAVGAHLDMATERGGSTLHEGMRGSAHVGRQGMALLIGRKGVLEDRLERDERYRCLRTRGRRRSSGGFLQYHATYPLCYATPVRKLNGSGTSGSLLTAQDEVCSKNDIFCSSKLRRAMLRGGTHHAIRMAETILLVPARRAVCTHR